MPLDPQLDPHFDEAARLNNLDPMLLRAVAEGESSGNPRAVSPQGAIGLMQIMPDTAKGLGVDPNDPVASIYGGAKLLNEALTKGEEIKAGGRDINPVAYALQTYFAGPEGSQWGPKTAAYPGYIASKYVALRDQQPKPGNATVADGDMGQPYTPPSGAERLAALSQRPQIASAGPNTDATITDTVERLPGGTEMRTAEGPFVGIDALRNVGKPQQTAQATPEIPSDEELLQGLREIAPLVNKGAAPAAPAPAAASAPAPAPSATNAPQPAMDVQGFIDTYNKYRGFPAGMLLANSALQAIMKMAPEGYVLNTDGSLSARTGGPADPNQARTLKSAEKQGNELLQPGPNGELQPQPGAAAATQAMANAKAAGAGTDLVSELAKQGRALVRQPDGSIGIGNMPGALTTTQQGAEAKAEGEAGPKAYNDTLAELGKSAEAARLGKYQAELFKQKLHEIGTSGPLTESLGRLSAFAQQLGIPAPKLPNGATVEQANALALNLLGDILKTQFPQRITNTDIAVFKPSSANPNMLSEATDFLIDKSIIPKFQREIARYGAAVNADLPQQTPQHLQRFLNEWDNKNPYSSFATGPDRAAIEQEMRRRGLLK